MVLPSQLVKFYEPNNIHLKKFDVCTYDLVDPPRTMMDPQTKLEVTVRFPYIRGDMFNS